MSFVDFPKNPNGGILLQVYRKTLFGQLSFSIDLRWPLKFVILLPDSKRSDVVRAFQPLNVRGRR